MTVFDRLPETEFQTLRELSHLILCHTCHDDQSELAIRVERVDVVVLKQDADVVLQKLDRETGETQVVNFVAAVDCGTPINPNLARVQAEGGILQGIGMALTENITYDRRGMPAENSLMQYKIPTRQDIGHISVEFEASYEETGPYGAKSIGEVVINTPLPAIADAVYNATGKRFRELPITPEQIAMAAK